MKDKIKISIQAFNTYKTQVEEYNKSLPVGIVKTYTNQKLLYKCVKCVFATKHKYDCLKHYRRIHIDGGKSRFPLKK
jgi:hypothetical protein